MYTPQKIWFFGKKSGRLQIKTTVCQSNDMKTCPWSMTRTRSHCSTVCMECAMMMSVQSQNVCRIVSCIRAAVSESSDDVASSSTTIYTTPAQLTIMHCQAVDLLRKRNRRFFGCCFHKCKSTRHKSCCTSTVSGVSRV